MSAVVQAPPPQVLPPRTEPGVEETRVLLHDVGWASYVAIGSALADHPGLRLTYDCGDLEFTTTSPQHEIYKKWLSKLIDIMAEEFGLPVVNAGNMTFQREDLKKGIEGDDCYWIAHEPQLRGKTTWDITREPPPDLMLEIEVSRSALRRMSIYAALRIAEVWCFDGASLRVYHLQEDGTYQPRDHSLSFPGVPLNGLAQFLLPSTEVDSLTMVRAFRKWLQTLRPDRSS